MDNVTHALVGLLFAELVVVAAERAQPRPPAVSAATYSVAIIGNNLPDLDFVYQRISGKTFGYLLQHRGYTHTVLSALAFAGVMLGVVRAVFRLRGSTLEKPDWLQLAAVAIASPLLHLVMDFANNYGVHPFWPFDNTWFYGDSFFIVEPAFWIVIIAPLAASYSSKLARGGLWFALSVSVGALWYEPFVPRRQAFMLTFLAALLVFRARGQAPVARAASAALGFAAVASLFVVSGFVARRTARAAALASSHGTLVLDVVATPMPANPFCWNLLLLERERGTYLVRVGRAAIAPSWLDLAHCPFDRDSRPTAPLQAAPEDAGASLVWASEYRLPVAELQALSGARCEAQAFFRFARAPYLTAAAEDGSRVLGDLRYDRNPGLDFADVRLAPTQGKCPAFVPPWRPPRADLLNR